MYNYRISSIRRRGYFFFFAVCFSAAIQEWLLFEGGVYFVGKPAAIISTRVRAPRKLAIRGLCLFRSELPIVWLLFEVANFVFFFFFLFLAAPQLLCITLNHWQAEETGEAWE